MTTDKRKAQQRKASKKVREDKKKAGFVRMGIWIKPEWKNAINELIKKLKREV